MTPLTIAELRMQQATLALRAERKREEWRRLPATAKAVALGKQVKDLSARADEYAALLREKPGQWALILCKPNERSASSTAYGIRTARNMRHYRPAGAFEAMSRTVDVKDADGVRRKEFRVYARFVGEESGE